jgi:primosomal protein N' (replication factor Y)
MKYLGVGTEKLEAEVQGAFPRAKVARLDADTARPKGELTRILTDLRNRNIDVLVGTQMITKGHDFPGITLVGVIEADLGLHLPDFRAAERTFQLLAQVGGRAGRGGDPGRVLVQTFSPEHYALIMAKKHDYLSFFEEERAQRLDCGYPPFGRLILARFSGGREEETRQAAEDARAVGRRILEQHPADVELIGPAPSALAKIKNKYRFQLLLRSPEVRPLHRFTAHWLGAVRGALKGSGVSVAVDVDPYHMM